MDDLQRQRVPETDVVVAVEFGVLEVVEEVPMPFFASRKVSLKRPKLEYKPQQRQPKSSNLEVVKWPVQVEIHSSICCCLEVKRGLVYYSLLLRL